MKKEHSKWRSPSLGRDMELLVYGDSGTPILALPTRGENCDQWEEHGMTESISYQLENGYNQLYCIDSIDDESFFNQNVSPSKRLLRHQQFESYVVEEVVPHIQENNPIDFLIVAGVDMGGYHAVNLALKYPENFGKAIGMSGVYDIKPFVEGYNDDSVYYNNPVAYMPNLNEASLLDEIRMVDFRLVSYEDDPRKEQATRLANVLQMKVVDTKLDIWDTEESDEWDLWQQMLKIHIV